MIEEIRKRFEEASRGPWSMSNLGIDDMDGNNILWATINEDIYGRKQDITFILHAKKDMEFLLNEMSKKNER